MTLLSKGSLTYSATSGYLVRVSITITVVVNNIKGQMMFSKCDELIPYLITAIQINYIRSILHSVVLDVHA